VRFGLWHEAGTYRELAEAARLAEDGGFGSYAVSERHFGTAVSAPELILPYVAAQTSRISLRWLDVPLLAFNHPIRVAERLATLDVISKGRAQLGTARSADLRTLQVFGIDSSEAGRQWDEAVEVIRTVLTQDPFEFHGEIWDIPPTHLEPQPHQQPHPPLFVSAPDLETHREAGRKGIGVVTLGSVDAEEALSTYRGALAEDAVTNTACVVEVLTEVDALAERAKHLEALGYDELVVRIEGASLQAIELIGEQVIPELAAA
jgi:alkanesulfonate monooxygenase SsuD/methylene tetrahydromethanopterin reductase-like flavin-dependent oxidoreductase (luciferase family)